MKTVIMVGGRGTRISELFPDIPKPLIPKKKNLSVTTFCVQVRRQITSVYISIY